jgi:hypothetical protein
LSNIHITPYPLFFVIINHILTGIFLFIVLINGKNNSTSTPLNDLSSTTTTHDYELNGIDDSDHDVSLF